MALGRMQLLTLVLLSVLVTHIRVKGHEEKCPANMAHSEGCSCTVDDDDINVSCNGSSQLTRVPDDLPKNTDVLKITANKFTNLTKISTYGKLTLLYLVGNHIEVIAPGAFSNLDKLEVLSLTGNDIHRLDESAFTGLHSLEILYVSINPLNYIAPKTFSGNELRSLTFLKLSDNSLPVLKESWFDRLPRLHTLNLLRNKIAQVEQFSNPDNLPLLEELHLSRNDIQELQPKQFSGLKSLKELFLVSNKLQGTLPPNAFSGLEKKLTLLNLRKNKLSPTLGDEFKALHNLEELHISENQLTWIDAHRINWGSLKRMYVHDNPWDCHCRNSWLLYQPQVKQNNVDAVRCNTPVEQKNVSVYEAIEDLDCKTSHKSRVGLALGLCFLAAVIVIGIIIFRKFYYRRRGQHSATASQEAPSRYHRVSEAGELIM